MNDGQIRVVQLACVSCSATLDISQGMERLACGFCGTSQTVERSGGAVSLKGVAAALQQVQRGTDRTAAELAIVRLTKEIEGKEQEVAALEKEVSAKVRRETRKWEDAATKGAEQSVRMPHMPHFVEPKPPRRLLGKSLFALYLVAWGVSLIALWEQYDKTRGILAALPYLGIFSLAVVVGLFFALLIWAFVRVDPDRWKKHVEAAREEAMRPYKAELKKARKEQEANLKEQEAKLQPERDRKIAEISYQINQDMGLVEAKASLQTLKDELAAAQEIVRLKKVQ